MATIRAKFRVETVEDMRYLRYPAKGEGEPDTEPKKYGERVVFHAVYSPDPDDENRAFWESTPSGRLEMQINNPTAFGRFVVNQEYYLDFSLARDVDKP
jgi:hypothetical protein